MSRLKRTAVRLVFALLAVLAASQAHAACEIITATATPLSASTGTYTPPVAPSAQSVTFTVSGTYNAALAGTCRVALSFNRASLPASMARTGGGATLPYTITSAPTGGNVLLYTGGGLPGLANLVVSSFPAPILGLGRPYSVTITAHFLAVPGSPQRAGSYSDTPTMRLFNVAQDNTITQVASLPFTLSGSVGLACTINNVTTGPADSAVVPVSATGVVNTAPIARSYASVVCNSLTAVQVTSQSGAVKRTAAAAPGFTNLINYSALASFGGATSTLNTATVATAVGPEAGTTGVTASATPTGTLSVTITPQATGSPLVPGGYSDTLRITLTAQ